MLCTMFPKYQYAINYVIVVFNFMLDQLRFDYNATDSAD